MTDVLDLIDGAISDWETSPDAMRWGAEPSTPPPFPSPRARSASIHEAFAQVMMQVTPAMRGFNRAMTDMRAKLLPVVESFDRDVERIYWRKLRGEYARRLRARRRRRRR